MIVRGGGAHYRNEAAGAEVVAAGSYRAAEDGEEADAAFRVVGGGGH